MTMTVSLSKSKNQRKEVGRYAASSFSYPPLSLRSSGIDFMLIFRLENAAAQRILTEHLELHRLDVLSSNGRLETYELVRQKLAQMRPEELKPAPLITGDDLIAEGYVPGPQFGRMLAAVEDAQLEGRVSTREQALDLVREQFGRPAASV